MTVLLARGLGALAVSALLGMGLGSVAAAPAQAASGRCSAGHGVTVVVDFGPLGGGVHTACDPDGGGEPAAQVTAHVGFDLDYVTSQPGFVCRIDGFPGSDAEDCGDTPPPDAYWGLFSSDGDPATWSYSSEGAGSLDVPDGGSIGWRFQDGGDREDPGAPPTQAEQKPSPQPSASPAPHPSHTQSPTSPGPAPSTSAPGPAAQPTSGGGDASPGEPGAGTGGAAKGDAKPEAGAGKSGKADKRGDRAGNGRDRTRQGPRDSRTARAEEDEDPTATVAGMDPASADATEDSGSALPTVLAGVAILALAGAAGVTAWRRRA